MIVTLEFAVRPGTAETVAVLAKETLASARAWEGCLAIEVGYADATDTVFVLEHWQSDEAAEAYRDWRRSNVPGNPVQDSGLLAAPPIRREFAAASEGGPSSAASVTREVVERFLLSFDTGDTDEIVKHLADDATYWVSGSREGSGTGVDIAKADFAAMHRVGADLYVDRRLTIVPTGWTVQGERVAVEAKGYGQLTNGRRHDNTYHFLFVVRDGKIREVREYNDTDLMFSVLSP